MPRTARDKDLYGIYYISQSSAKGVKLFSNDTDRENFLSILSKSKNINDFRLYAYCLADPDKYHLIVCTNGSDISKIMKEINIGYAMYLNIPAPIYKDRYKSQLIKNKEDLLSIIDRIHATGKKTNSQYNSYCFFNGENVDDGLLDIVDLNNLEEADDCLVSISKSTDCIRTKEEAIRELERLANCKNITIDSMFKDKPLRNSIIRDFRKNSTLSLKELGEVFGGLSESSICKILKKS